jgi:uncharacterized membrane protein YfcA
MTLDALVSGRMGLAICIAAVAGVIRGVTGFGGSMVMTPPLALLFGPQAAVPIVLLLEAFAAMPMMRDAAARANWRELAPIGAAACAAAPLGGYVLLTADPQLLRRAIAALVLLFAGLLLWGARWRGRRGVAQGLACGAVSGTLLGATGIGGPPVILYMLSGPDSVAVMRATLTLFVVVISLAGLAILALNGLLTTDSFLMTLPLVPLFFAGVLAGSRLFQHVSEQRFRQLTLWLLLVVSLGILVA